MGFTQNIRSSTKIKKFVREVSLPILLLITYFLIFHFQKFISIPSQNQFLDLILKYINNQSLLLIFIIALFEGGIILGQYAPGGLVLFLSIVSAGTNIPKIILLVLVISIAFLIAYTFDYFVGYYGVNALIKKIGLEKYVVKFKRLLDKSVFSAIFFTYWDTNLASILSVAAGSLKIPYKKFIVYSTLFVFFWNIFWAVLLFFFGNLVIQMFGPQYLILIVIIWIVWVFYTNFIRKEEEIIENMLT